MSSHTEPGCVIQKVCVGELIPYVARLLWARSHVPAAYSSQTALVPSLRPMPSAKPTCLLPGTEVAGAQSQG